MAIFRLTVSNCEGHGVCYTRWPSLFQPDESGYCEIPTEIVPVGLLQQAELAASQCPERAIHLEGI